MRGRGIRRVGTGGIIQRDTITSTAVGKSGFYGTGTPAGLGAVVSTGIGLAEINAPTDLSGLVIWLDAGQASGMDGNNLASWPDVSGAGFDLNVQDGATVFHSSGGPNNLPYVAFSNGALSRGAPLVTGADPAMTCFCISKGSSNVASAGEIIYANGTYGLNGLYYSAGTADGVNREVYIGGISRETDGAATTVWEKSCMINTHTGGSPGAQRMRINGVEKTLSASNGTPAAATLHFAVGGAKDAITNKPFGGGIAEVFIYNRVLSASEIAQVEQYLTTKYGL